MCTLYTYTNICMPRFSPSGFFGPSRCLIPTPGITSKYFICVVYVCVCVYAHPHPHTLPLAWKVEKTQTTPLSLLLSKITSHAKQAKCTVLVIQHHYGQTFGTYLGGWERRRPVRRGCGALPREFFEDDFWSIFEKVSWSWKTEFLEIRDFKK